MRKKTNSMNIPAPQRLNAREQAWLVGICEADGSFGVHKIRVWKFLITCY